MIRNICNKEQMAINGWEIWNNIFINTPNMEETVFFVVIKELSESIINHLIRCFVYVRRINNVCIITNYYEKDLTCFGKNTKRVKLSSYEIDCLLTYYSICQFTDCFYVLSLKRLGRKVPKECEEEFSEFEIAAAGILKLNRKELNAYNAKQNCQ